jgi:hypothetical protein
MRLDVSEASDKNAMIVLFSFSTFRFESIVVKKLDGNGFRTSERSNLFELVK